MRLWWEGEKDVVLDSRSSNVETFGYAEFEFFM